MKSEIQSPNFRVTARKFGVALRPAPTSANCIQLHDYIPQVVPSVGAQERVGMVAQNNLLKRSMVTTQDGKTLT